MPGSVVYDSDADVLYVRLRDGASVHHSKNLDDVRILDYSEDGAVVGVEFVNASEGVDLSDVPFAPTVETLIGNSGHSIRIFA